MNRRVSNYPLLPTVSSLSQRMLKAPFNQLNYANNGDNHLLEVECDYEAVQAFLSRFKSSGTVRQYRREVERLLLWCAYNNISFGQITKEITDNYVMFLEDPEPYAVWCYLAHESSKRRNQTGWKPFKAGLSHNALNYHLKIINALFDFLVKAQYLRNNPFALAIKPKHASEFNKYKLIERIPTKEEWKALLDALNAMQEGIKKARLKFIIYTLFYTGMRISELANLSWDDFQLTQSGWSLFIIGKGGKPREIVVENLLDEIIAYRKQLGLSVLPLPDENAYVVCDLEGSQGISDRQIFNLVKNLARKASENAHLSLDSQMRLKKFSPHWIRHLCPTLMAKSGVDTRTIQRHLGHSSASTTEVYVHIFDESRRNAVKNLNINQF